MPKSTSKIFLDASVILAAFGSPSGGSALIINYQGKAYKCITSVDIIAEVLHKSYKLKATESALKNFLKKKNILIITSPTEEQKHQFDEVVADKKDRHVLASAKESGADFLLSYDRKHIVVPKVKKALKPTKVITPKEFLTSKPL